MPDDKKTFKEKRQDRQQGRIDKLTEKRIDEAKKAGVDLNSSSDIITSGPQSKSEIDAKINKGVKEDIRAGLQKIQSVRKAPKVDVPEKPTIDLNIQDVRKERRNKIANVMNAFGQGLAGEQVDAFKYTRPYKEERLAQYQQYKNTSQAAKQRLNEWESGYINEQLAYLTAKRDDPRTSDLERKKTQKEIERTEAQTNQINAKTKQIKSKKDKDPETARVVNKINDSESITRNIPLDEAKDRENKAAIKEAISVTVMELNQAKLELADMGKEGTKGREFIDKRKRSNLEAKILELETQIQDIIDEFGTKETDTDTLTTEEDIWKL